MHWVPTRQLQGTWHAVREVSEGLRCEGYLAVPNRGVAPGIRSKKAPQGISTTAVHHRVAWKGPVQILFNLRDGPDHHM